MMQRTHVTKRIALSAALGLSLAVFATVPVMADEPSRQDFPVVVPQPAPEPVAPPPPAKEEKPCGVHWGIGLGAGIRPDYEGSNDYKPFPIGFARVWWDEGYDIELRGTESSGSAVRLSANVIPSNDFELGPVLQYRISRDEVHSGRVDALDGPDGTFEAGAFAAYTPGPWRIGATYTYDVGGEYDGGLLELAGGWQDKLTDLVSLGFSVASTWASNSYMSNYFGVTPADSALTGFDAYDADAGFKDVGGRVTLGIGGQEWDGWKIFGSASYFRMIGDAEDSPIVDDAGDANQFFGGVGVAYEH
jgi:outer membrane scaffolding protein for murein synthesis (MipA/OmpV family)